MLELWDETRTNSQARIQDEINLHNQEKKVVKCKLNASGAMDLVKQPQTQVLHSPQPLGKGTTPLPIIYFMTLNEGYIQMAFFF